MLDRTTKILLGVIAIGIWLNVGVSVLRPSSAIAQSGEIGAIAGYVAAIAKGTCSNQKIC